MDEARFTLNAKLYDLLKWIALVLLPAVGTLYFALGQLWHFPAIEEVVGSITALDAFLGVLINKSSKNYNEKQIVGDLIMGTDIDGNAFMKRLEGDRDPLILEVGKNAIFRVKREQDL